MILLLTVEIGRYRIRKAARDIEPGEDEPNELVRSPA
jgi:hypothetical protein